MITPKTQAIVALLNDVIKEAIAVGADIVRKGSSYHQNIDNLMIAINNFLHCIGLGCDYEIQYNKDDVENYSQVKVVENKYAFKVKD